jgi:DNA repair photolyase
MGLNTSKGNMYEWITHTWNTVKGECPHECSYCYMSAIRRRFNKGPQPPRFDETELRTNLGVGNFIFVGSSNDLFADGIPDEWIIRTLDHCAKFDNRYLFQSKNPARILDFINHPVFCRSVVCTTIESSYHFPDFMGRTDEPIIRSRAMRELSRRGVLTYVTIEPIMKFHLNTLVEYVAECNPTQVNIGADSGHNLLPEPSRDNVIALITDLKKFTTVKQKTNLARLLNY